MRRFRLLMKRSMSSRNKGVYPVDRDMLIEGALRGMADVIGDPYSTYLSQEEAAAHKESLAGERIGIGAEITRSNGKYIIVAPVKVLLLKKRVCSHMTKSFVLMASELMGNHCRTLYSEFAARKGQRFHDDFQA